jgi:hypothetical protein
MGKAFIFVCSLGLVLFVGFELVHLVVTGELASITKGGLSPRSLSLEDEPGQFVLTLMMRVIMLLAGFYGMFIALRDGDPPLQGPE